MRIRLIHYNAPANEYTLPWNYKKAAKGQLPVFHAAAANNT